MKIELPKQGGSYEYAMNQSYTMHITSKLDMSMGVDSLETYTANGGIRNKAELLFDQKSFISNEAVIIPPTFGKIEIESRWDRRNTQINRCSVSSDKQRWRCSNGINNK